MVRLAWRRGVQSDANAGFSSGTRAKEIRVNEQWAGARRDGRVANAATGDALRFPRGSVTWLCSGERLTDAETTFGYVAILPGK